MVLKFWLGMLHVGKPSGIGEAGHYDCAITLCWGRRRRAPCDELQWRRIWRFAFDWGRTRPPAAKIPDPLVSQISGKLAASLHSEDAPPIWRHQFTTIRSTWRSKVYVYLTGQKERQNPRHIMYVTPGVPGLAGMSANDVPEDWKMPSADGTAMVPKQFEVVFIHGRANVDEKLGEWLVTTGHAQRSALARVTGKALLGGLASLISGR